MRRCLVTVGPWLAKLCGRTPNAGPVIRRIRTIDRLSRGWRQSRRRLEDLASPSLSATDPGSPPKGKRDELTEADEKEALNPAAWVDLHGDYLYRYALSRLRNGEAAEEVVQQTFLVALQHTDQFAGKGTERAWLLGILKRKIVDLIRQRNRTSTLNDDADSDLSEALFDRNGRWKPKRRSDLREPLDSLEREEFWRILRGCLDTLPPRQADVFVLREMDDRSTDEICKDLEISASNLWVLLYRARLQLSNCMRSRWQQESS
ncbi:MAG: sigma-70 family RNA polymerase sigma factor [Planctomycetes bacterium]|nr:sigma-70 family RNA polymerase sigma factor [Planctomycetia bacterium]MBI3464688.1 sigma-70 family RNA polymerase sigma factor [Planctomycetota bacterium]